MSEFIFFALYLCLSAMLLVVIPVMLHPTLPMRKKVIICLFTFIFVVPFGLFLYAALGVPSMAIAL